VQFDRPRIGNLLDAQFSFQYALAVGASSGRATLDQFSPQRDRDAEVQRLMAATEVLADREMPAGTYPPLEVRFKDGRRIERHVKFAKGAPENPLTDDELRAKAVSQIEPVLGKSRCGAVLACVSALEDVHDLREVTQLLAAETSC
jgi:2-methylcitrate dehydratase PrpD